MAGTAPKYFRLMIRFSPNPNRANLIRWQEWGDNAFREAQAHDKPVMLFLSAFWCRYCQRMDEEAFSETENIALLRAYFVSIRAENGQRPDVDCRYNQNGWPTIVFMTPRGKPIIVANYLPSDQFEELLLRIYMGHQQSKSAEGLEEKALTESVAVEMQARNQAPPAASNLRRITRIIMELADPVNGGYGRSQKFIQAEANDFLLSRFRATKDSSYLDHVCLTLDRMREGAIHDRKGGAYFRTTTGADWSQPHREKLLAEQAGLLRNSLRTFRITQQPVYAEMAEDILAYLNGTLFSPETGTFCGCEDFLRRSASAGSPSENFFTILDRCVYTDANAQTIVAYLEAFAVLGKPIYKERVLTALEFLWDYCRDAGGGMYHYFDGAPRVHGLLNDQTAMGTALLEAYGVTRDAKYLERARELAEFIWVRLKNPGGGYYDISTEGPAYLQLRLTLIEQNGPAASFFLALAETTGEPRYREAARWALSAFAENVSDYGIHAASLGQALGKYLSC
ncbi:MAG TPA: DUF255 domain-containing protein [Candidatus Binatia bacterium]